MLVGVCCSVCNWLSCNSVLSLCLINGTPPWVPLAFVCRSTWQHWVVIANVSRLVDACCFNFKAFILMTIEVLITTNIAGRIQRVRHALCVVTS